MKKSAQSGVVAPALLLVAAVGLISYLLISSSAEFKNNLFASLYPKKSSFASTGVGSTDPNGFPSPEPTGIGSTAPSSSSSPTPTPTPPPPYIGPTPSPDPWGGKTIHAIDGTNCFDSDENFPVNDDWLVKGYCVDKTGVYYDSCSGQGSVLDFFCNSYDPPYQQYTTYCREGGGGGTGMRSCVDGAYTIFPTRLIPTPTPLDSTAPTPTPIPISLAPDTTSPTASIISPQHNSDVSGTVTVEVSASDNSGIRKVEFYIYGEYGDGQDKLVATLTKPPYTYIWDTTQYYNNTYYLFFVYVYDVWNNSVLASVGAYVQNPSVPTPTPIPTPPDSISPTIKITQPGSGATVSGLVTINVDASDNIGVSKVEIYSEGQPPVTLTSAPYTTQWDTSLVQNGSRKITTYAYDAVNNSGVATELVNVNNQPLDTTPPTAPTNLSAFAAAYNKVNLSWNPSTDNIGVTGYWIIRNNTTIAQTTSTSYTDNSVTASSTYDYRIVAFDTVGNNSSSSNTANVTTPSTPDTQPPTTPTNLVAQAVSDTQINLSWNPSTDNVGVSAYQIYRNNILIASVSATSFGDINLSPVTEYNYYVVAVDAANNKSASSNIATATTTQTPIKNGAITGTITSSAGGVISGAKVSIKIGKTTRTAYTSSTGVYVIADIPPGSYSVTYSAKQHINQSQSVTIPNSATVVKNVTLQKR